MKLKCNLCGSDKFKEVYTIKKILTFRIVKCRKCGLVYMNPRPKKSEIKNMYDEKYYRGEGFDKGVDYISGLKQTKGWLIILKDRIQKIEQYSQSKGNILDVGSGMGEFLHCAKERGWKVQGIELSDYSAKISRKTFKIPVFEGTIEEANFKKESFDVITMCEVIEHLSNPYESLLECNTLLKKGGIIVIETGNIESLSAKFYGSKWHYFLAGHFYYFSKDTISKMLLKTGFEIVKIYNGDEISLRAKMKYFWMYKDVNIKNIFKSLWIGIAHIIRKFGIGGMTVYAKKK